MTMKSTTPCMDHTLAPRDERGLIQPMSFSGGTDGNGQVMYYPFLPPNPDGGIDPMIFESDFRPGGRYYGRIEYHPGFYPADFGVMPSGYVRPFFPGGVIFCDPLYNLPALPQRISDNGIPPFLMPSAVQTAAELAQAGALPQGANKAMPESDDDTMFVTNQRGNAVPVCNCRIEVQRLIRTVLATDSHFEVDLLLTVEGISEQVRIPEKDLGRLADFLGERFPWFHLSAEGSAAALLNAYIRDQLKAAPQHTVFKSCGWVKWGTSYIYAHDGHPASANLSFDCGHAILADSSLSAAQAFRSALGILDIGKLTVTLPLFLTALLGVLAAVFEDAGCPPRFCTFLHGLSGSLKSAAAEVFVSFFGVRDHSTFRDTPAAIDVAVGKHRDRVLLVDDFQPAVVASEGRNMKKILEHLLRLFGDSIGKKRSNTRATATTGNPPRGSCIITGESVSGSYSSLLRCLMVPISRGDIDGMRLRAYQENPTLFTTVYSFFLPWVGENWDKLAAMIRASFPTERAAFSGVTPEPRLADAGAMLKLTGAIFLEFGLFCGAIDQTEAHQHLAHWEGVIRGLLSISTDTAQDLDLVVLTREAIASALVSGSLEIASDASSFQAGMDGFYTPNRLWLRHASFAKAIRAFCCDTQAVCVPTKAILPELYARGVIIRDEESGKNSYLKRTPILPALKQRPRMICFEFAELKLDD